MNKYEKRAQMERKTAIRASMSVWNAGLALMAVAFLILGFRGSAPSSFYTKAGLAVAVIWLILRQVSRQMGAKRPRAAQPDLKSVIKLD